MRLLSASVNLVRVCGFFKTLAFSNGFQVAMVSCGSMESVSNFCPDIIISLNNGPIAGSGKTVLSYVY